MMLKFEKFQFKPRHCLGITFFVVLLMVSLFSFYSVSALNIDSSSSLESIDFTDVKVSNFDSLLSAISTYSSPVRIILGNNITLGSDSLAIPSGKIVKLTSIASEFALIGADDKSVIVVEAGGELWLDGIIVTHKNGDFGRGVENSGSLYLVNGVIFGNTIIDNGGGVYNYEGGQFTMMGGAIANNTATNGGGIYNAVNDGTGDVIFKLTGGIIANNTATNGGGIYNYDFSVFYLMGTGTIANNTAVYGGGVYNEYDFHLETGSITGNTAEYGGGVYNTAIFNLCNYGVVANNTATNGGGIYSEYTILMSDGVIANNTATNGGGIYILREEVESLRGRTVIDGGVIANNTATQNGGGIWISEQQLGDLSVGADGAFYNNYAGNGAYNIQPIHKEIYSENIGCTSWSAFLTQGYNNYDISYTQGNPLRLFSVAIHYRNAMMVQGVYFETAKISINAYNRTLEYNRHLTFDSWLSADVEFEDKTSASTTFIMPSKNVLATTTWRYTEYNIEYVLGVGGVNHEDNPNTYTIQGLPYTIYHPSRADYVFHSWDIMLHNTHIVTLTATDGQNYVTFRHNSFLTESDNADVVFVARWSPIQYDIMYNLKGGTNSPNNPVTYTIESNTITLENPTREGYDFIAWTPTNSIPKGSTGDKEFTAVWSAAVVYNIVYNLNGGINVQGNPTVYTVESGFPIIIEAPSKTGYTFLGWTATSEGESNSGPYLHYVVEGVVGDIELTANWGQQYAINYVLNGGVNAAGNPTAYATEEPAKRIFEPSMTGYGFLGWTVRYANGSGHVLPVRQYEILSGTFGDIVLTAHWIRLEVEPTRYYQVTYNANGAIEGTVPVDVRGPHVSGSVVLVLGQGSLAWEGYTFRGWATTPEGEVKYVGGSAFSLFKDTELFAVWSPNEEVTTTQHTTSTLSNKAEAVLETQNTEGGLFQDKPLTDTVMTDDHTQNDTVVTSSEAALFTKANNNPSSSDREETVTTLNIHSIALVTIIVGLIICIVSRLCCKRGKN